MWDRDTAETSDRLVVVRRPATCRPVTLRRLNGRVTVRVREAENLLTLRPREVENLLTVRVRETPVARDPEAGEDLAGRTSTPVRDRVVREAAYREADPLPRERLRVVVRLAGSGARYQREVRRAAAVLRVKEDVRPTACDRPWRRPVRETGRASRRLATAGDRPVLTACRAWRAMLGATPSGRTARTVRDPMRT